MTKEGDLPLIQTYETLHLLGTDATVWTETVADGMSKLGGVFSLSVNHDGMEATTRALPFNVTADRLKAELELLPNVGALRVSRFGPDPHDGYEWMLTFLENVGDVALLEVLCSPVTLGVRVWLVQLLPQQQLLAQHAHNEQLQWAGPITHQF